MKAFSFSLDGATKDWLYLQSVLFNTWGDMKCMFLEKFFPASKTATIRKEICGIRQHFGETLHEYWERFNKLCATCPHHQISEQLLIQYFYKGLTIMDISMTDVASGGALIDKMPAAARHLISNMASNTQQFGIRGAGQPRILNEIGIVDNLRLENQLTELTSLVRQLAVGQHQPSIVARVYGICTFMEHPTNMCPTLQETELNHLESVGVIGGYQYGKQPYQSRHLAIWTCPECTSRSSQLSTAKFAISSITFPTTAVIKSASSRQLAISGGPDEAAGNKQSGVLTKYELQQHAIPSKHEHHHPRPQDANRTTSQYCEPFTINRVQQPSLQTIPNPRGNASVVTLRSAPLQEPRPIDADSKLDANSQVPQQDRSVPLPFPTQTISTKKRESNEELLKMFQKVEINIPLLDAIKQIPKYAKFLKELCMHKRKKMKGGVESRGTVSTLTRSDEFTTGVQQALPKKCRDPKIFSIPCTIGDYTFANAMLDLGASINVMPTSIYKSLKFGDLEPTGMTIQLANRSVVQPLGVLEDVLVQVNELIFPADFYVLDMEDETSGKGSTLILGRPFLMTAKIKIDVHAGTLSMEFGDHLVQFNIFEAMKHPTEDHSLFGIYLIDELVGEHLRLNTDSDNTLDFATDTHIFDCLGSVTVEADCNELREVHDFSNSKGGITDLVDLGPEEELLDLLDQVCKHEDLKYSNNARVQVVGIEKQLSA
ncbi:hypothetical protein CR513_17561, partial [Mucuna pruriens]